MNGTELFSETLGPVSATESRPEGHKNVALGQRQINKTLHLCSRQVKGREREWAEGESAERGWGGPEYFVGKCLVWRLEFRASNGNAEKRVKAAGPQEEDSSETSERRLILRFTGSAA